MNVVFKRRKFKIWINKNNKTIKLKLNNNCKRMRYQTSKN